jgi:hypothetical protein
MMSTKDTSDSPVSQETPLNDVAALSSMYAEFAKDEAQLAHMGLAAYAPTLDEEERRDIA